MDHIWTQVDIYTTTAGLEILGSALADIGHPYFSVVDAADFEDFIDGKQGAWDYIDDGLLKLREAETTITVYLPDNRQGRDGLAAIRGMLERLKAADTEKEWGRLECSLSGVKEEDWATAWKKYYKPVTIGKKLIICPSWEECDPAGRIMMRLDPGMAFGTGTHETTRLCLEALEDAVSEGLSVLDIGCGSGILSIGALLLGAGSALGVDIDQIAVNSARENAALNGVSDRARFLCGNLADRVDGTYDIICANIVADIILLLAPGVPRLLKPGGRFIVSGIIGERESEVTDALVRLGFTQHERRGENGWVCLVLSR